MPRAIVHLPSGEVQTIVVGKDDVTNIFVDEKTGNLVVLTAANAVNYGKVPYVVERTRKEKE